MGHDEIRQGAGDPFSLSPGHRQPVRPGPRGYAVVVDGRTHRWLGLGEMPTGPIVEYLARSLSAFYALVGALCLVMASDLDRYRPLVRFFGVCLALLGIVFTGVDLAAGMPWWWTALEGPGAMPIGALVYFLARPVHRAGS
jgi:hypothetical protein